MQVERSNAFGPVEPARLRAFEARIGAALPEDYRAFVLAHNGGCPVPCDFLISAAEGESSLHHTYGLHDGPAYLRLDDALDSYGPQLPEGLLPIADDPGGNAICLGLVGAARGRVYFWDHETGSEPPSWGDVIEMAPSFTAFCAGLSDMDS
jgi:hypothetical protein